MISASLLVTFLLTSAVAANPVIVSRSPVTLPLSRRFNVTRARNLLRHDRARAQEFKNRGSSKGYEARAVVYEPAENQAVTYVASIGVGIPPTMYSLIIDTGSANTWIGAGKPYVPTITSVQTPNSVSVSYGSGSFSGTEFTDTLTGFAPGLVVVGQSIGVASNSTGLDGVDGILGIGPADLTLGTLSPATNSTIPTVTDNLFYNGVITANEIGISFEPTTQESVVNGELTWGGTDSTKFTGSINYTPITTASPASNFWGIDQSVRYGDYTTILSSTAGIVDTGTTLILLATDGFNRYMSATGAVLDDTTGLPRITSTQFANLQSLFFTTNGVTYALTANAQVWPRSLNTFIGGTASSIYLIVHDLGSPSGEGLDFVNGFGFLERFYSVFDTTNKRVGFATTPFTTVTTN